MFCPDCGGEFRPEILQCPDCERALVEELPKGEEEQGHHLVALPLLNHADVTIVPSILESAGIFVRVESANLGGLDSVLVRSEDLPRIKELLAEYRSSGSNWEEPLTLW